LTRSRIIYITGMNSKPPVGPHRDQLIRVLKAGLERVNGGAASWIDDAISAFTLVSWTGAFYPAPRDIALDLPGIERLLTNPEPTDAERRELLGWPRRLKRRWHLICDSLPALASVALSPALKLTLSDVRRYLENRNGLASQIRTMVAEQIEQAWRDRESVLLIGHSLGSVIAYDTLWELSRAARRDGAVDLFITLGSPIATRFIRQSIKGTDCTDENRYPANIRVWHNFSACGELVALHRRLEPFFRPMLELELTSAIIDEPNLLNAFHGADGLDVHKSYAYLHDRAVAGSIAKWWCRRAGS
jgi:hypothetical protein